MFQLMFQLFLVEIKYCEKLSILDSHTLSAHLSKEDIKK